MTQDIPMDPENNQRSEHARNALRAPAEADTGITWYQVSESQQKFARKFFEPARTRGEPPEYCMQIWLSGLRHDPTALPAVQSYLAAARKYVEEHGRKAQLPENVRDLLSHDEFPHDPFLHALSAFAIRPRDTSLVIEAANQAAELPLRQVFPYLGRCAIALVRKGDTHVSKPDLVKLVCAYQKCTLFDEAVTCVQLARANHPDDSEIVRLERDVLAARQIHRQEQQLVDNGPHTTASTPSRQMEPPSSGEDTAMREAETLIEQGLIPRAIACLTLAYKETGNSKYRERELDLRIELRQEELGRAKEELSVNPGAAAQLMVDRTWQELLKLQVARYKVWHAQQDGLNES